MAITSTDIEQQVFSSERRGYNVEEVDVFLERVASEVDSMNARIADLQKQLEERNADANVIAQALIIAQRYVQ